MDVFYLKIINSMKASTPWSKPEFVPSKFPMLFIILSTAFSELTFGNKPEFFKICEAILKNYFLLSSKSSMLFTTLSTAFSELTLRQ
ncbi:MULTISPECIES: hypothetical protein [Enterococcus]|nr:hypothetical protein [Enterococcus hirae]EMF0098936.1 hypothetical protein [Enterococcus hirae]